MTQEDKELLLKDLCARLPYGVKMNHIADDEHSPKTLIGVAKDMITLEGLGGYDCVVVEDYKPYLFPLSSITEEQSMELFKLFGINLVDSIGADYIKINECTGITFFLNKGFDVETHLDKLIDWLNKNHFDYRGLIEKGLAIDATGLNIY